MKNTLLDMRSKADDDLKSELKNLQEELFNLKFQKATEQLENSQKIGKVKQDIARVKTVLRERELGISAVAAKR